MEMVSTITSLITNVVNFAGGLLLLFGAVTLGTNLKDHNGPGISSGAWSIAGGVLIIAVNATVKRVFMPDFALEFLPIFSSRKCVKSSIFSGFLHSLQWFDLQKRPRYFQA